MRLACHVRTTRKSSARSRGSGKYAERQSPPETKSRCGMTQAIYDINLKRKAGIAAANVQACVDLLVEATEAPEALDWEIPDMHADSFIADCGVDDPMLCDQRLNTLELECDFDVTPATFFPALVEKLSAMKDVIDATIAGI